MSSSGRKVLIVEGWTGIPQSYALVNQFQLLELLRRADVEVYQREAPFHSPSWKRAPGILDAQSEEAIAGIPRAKDGMEADAIYRISYPYDLTPAPEGKRLCVFGTAEHRWVPGEYLKGERKGLGQACREQGNLMFVTPSNWSRDGFIASGAEAAKVFVVPHGVEAKWFHEIDQAGKENLRRQFGLEGFIFLTVGAITPNKGMDFLLKAFAEVVKWRPECRLVIKGVDAIYTSKQVLDESARKLTGEELARVQPRMRYVGGSLGQADMARVYQVADAYVSPYTAEGFNMPVLEAAACGLPVVCTAGGSTDDFTTSDFALPVEADLMDMIGHGGAKVLVPHVDSLVERMKTVVERAEVRERAMRSGPAFVRERFTWKQAVDRLVKVLFPV